jgi:periplasmic mercuric ion binding protein
MRLKLGLVLASASALAVLGAAALAETTVEVKGVHLCCGACVKGVAAALKGIDGVKPACDQKAKTVTITATDEAAAQKALDALFGAGYFGTIEAKGFTVQPVSNLPTGKVKSLSLSNSHNCCKQCCVAIKKAVGAVSGVSSDTAQPKKADFDVTGDFEAAAVVKSLNDAGFQVKVKE